MKKCSKAPKDLIKFDKKEYNGEKQKTQEIYGEKVPYRHIRLSDECP